LDPVDRKAQRRFARVRQPPVLVLNLIMVYARRGLRICPRLVAGLRGWAPLRVVLESEDRFPPTKVRFVVTTVESTAFAAPGESGSPVELKDRYENFIGGRWVPPTTREYRENVTPSTGEPFCEVAHSGPEDIELALDAAHAAKDAWGHRSPAERAAVLNAMADAIEENLEMLSVAESYENGKPVRETLAADIPLSVDHLRYFAGAVRSEEGRISEIDENTYAYHFHEPLGVVGQIIPFNFPLLMAAWKIAPALAAGNCSVIKPASPTPWSILKLLEVVEDIVPAGVINVVNGPGAEIGKALASNKRIAKIGFTGETVTGRLIMSYAAQNLIPSTTELGGKSPNIFFEDVMAADDSFVDKAVEGLVLYAFNKGEVCTCPSRALIQESIYPEFIERCLERIAAIKQGDPLDRETMIGAQVSASQLEKIENYVAIGINEGADVLIGGHRPAINGRLAGGYYFEPTVLKGHNKMRVFQEEIFGPVLAVTTFKDEPEALEIANDTLYGLGAGVWTRDTSRAFRMGRAIQAGRVWTNCYHQYPAHAAFGGYKQSGVGRENHRMMLDHYTQTKCLLVSYDPNPMGFF
jgi:aldehyde dehydrogenase